MHWTYQKTGVFSVTIKYNVVKVKWTNDDA